MEQINSVMDLSKEMTSSMKQCLTQFKFHSNNLITGIITVNVLLFVGINFRGLSETRNSRKLDPHD